MVRFPHLFSGLFCTNYILERVEGIHDAYRKLNSNKNWATVWRYVGDLCSDPELYIEIARDDSKWPVYLLDKLTAILLSPDRVGSRTLTPLLNIARKNLELLAGELKEAITKTNRRQ